MSLSVSCMRSLCTHLSDVAALPDEEKVEVTEVTVNTGSGHIRAGCNVDSERSEAYGCNVVYYGLNALTWHL